MVETGLEQVEEQDLMEAQKLILGALRSNIMYYNPQEVVANDNGDIALEPRIMLCDYVDDKGMPIMATGATLEAAFVNLAKEVTDYLQRDGAPVLLSRMTRHLDARGQVISFQRVVRMQENGAIMMGTHEVPRFSNIVKFKVKA